MNTDNKTSFKDIAKRNAELKKKLEEQRKKDNERVKMRYNIDKGK